jgi:ribosomal protein S18 acetylase RimI-like enzyme
MAGVTGWIKRGYMITIRELAPEDDLGAVLRLCREFFTDYTRYHEEFFGLDTLNDADISGRFLASIGSDDSTTLIALQGDEIVGYALLAVRDQPGFYKVKKVGAISGLMVSREYRRRGIATRLIDEARTYFGRQGVRYFTLYTSAANEEAIRFYEVNGLSVLQTVFVGET